MRFLAFHALILLTVLAVPSRGLPATPTLVLPNGVLSCVKQRLSLGLLPNRHAFPSPKLQKSRLVDEVMKSKNYWFDPQFAAYLEAHPDEVVPLARAWYASEMFPQMIYPRFVQVVGKKRAHLMLDPRILCRTDDFLKWSGEYLKAHPQASGIELRAQFAKTLGTSKVFRGMRLQSADEAMQLKRDGIQSAGLKFQNKSFMKEKLLFEIDPKSASPQAKRTFASGFGTEMLNRPMNKDLDKSILVSVSDWMELAASVGYHHGQAEKLAPNGKLFLFEMDIPEFELIRQAGPLDKAGAFRKGRGFYQIGNQRIDYDPYKIEAFIPYQVRPEWIRTVHSYNEPPPRWHFQP